MNWPSDDGWHIDDNGEQLIDNSFDSLFLCKYFALFGSCETECILDDVVLEENAGMIV